MFYNMLFSCFYMSAILLTMVKLWKKNLLTIWNILLIMLMEWMKCYFLQMLREGSIFFPFRFRDECHSPKPQGRGV